MEIKHNVKAAGLGIDRGYPRFFDLIDSGLSFEEAIDLGKALIANYASERLDPFGLRVENGQIVPYIASREESEFFALHEPGAMVWAEEVEDQRGGYLIHYTSPNSSSTAYRIWIVSTIAPESGYAFWNLWIDPLNIGVPSYGIRISVEEESLEAEGDKTPGDAEARSDHWLEHWANGLSKELLPPHIRKFGYTLA